MEDRTVEIERRLETLERRVLALETREGRAAAAVADETPATILFPELSAWPALVGRACLILAGAYLVRAPTLAGGWPPAAGVAAGLVYASVWLVFAHREASYDRRLSGAVSLGCSAVIVLPLLWEARLRLGVLSDASVALLWALHTAAMLGVAVRHRWTTPLAIVGLGSMTLGCALLVATQAPAPLFFALLTIAVVTSRVSWAGAAWRWMPALLLEGAAALLTIAAGSTSTLEWLRPERVTFGLCLLWGSFLAAALVRSRATAWGASLNLVVVAVLVSAAAGLPWENEAWPRMLGGAVVVCAAVLGRLASRSDHPFSRVALASSAVLLAVFGSAQALTGAPRVAVWSAVALAAAAGARTRPVAWAASAFALAAAWTTGLLPLRGGWESPSVDTMAIAVFVVLLIALALASRGAIATPATTAPRVVVLALAGSATVTVTSAGILLTPLARHAAAGAVPSIALAGLAAVLLHLRPDPRLAGARTVGLGAAVVAALRIVLDDMTQGPPERRLVALVALGGMLLAARRAPAHS